MGERLTTSGFSDRLKRLYGGRLVLVGDYIDSDTHVKIRCTICNHEEYRHPRALGTGTGKCLVCSPRGRSRLTSDAVRQAIYDLVGDEYTLLENYSKAFTPVAIRHNCADCNFHEYNVVIKNFRYQGKRCPVCSAKRGGKKVTDRGIASFESFFEGIKDYEMLEPLRRQKDKILFNCVSCDHPPFMMTPDKFKYGQRCPLCQASKGEQRVYSFLNSHSIPHVYQHVFEDCVYTQPLRFDFGLQNEAGDIIALVEYDGEQHVKIVEIYGGEEGLRSLQERDAIKNNYCNTNDISLLRIPAVDEDNIEKLLTKFIKEVYTS